MILIIADGAAFGPEIEKIVSLMRIQEGIYLYLPESFEWMILNSGIIADREIEMVLAETWDYVESSRFISWEQYFLTVLKEKTKETYLAYTKKSINKAYLGSNVKKNILKQIEFLF